MIRLVFFVNRETFSIDIENKIIVYKDRKLPVAVQFMPLDPDLDRKVLFSRNRIPKRVLDWVEDANSGKNLEEYQAAKTDEDLVVIVKKDAGSRGCIFKKRIDNFKGAEE